MNRLLMSIPIPKTTIKFYLSIKEVKVKSIGLSQRLKSYNYANPLIKNFFLKSHLNSFQFSIMFVVAHKEGNFKATSNKTFCFKCEIENVKYFCSV